MKKFFKKPLLLFGSLLTVAGLSFVSSQEAEVTAQYEVKWCEYPKSGPCKDPMVKFSCVCNDQC